MWSLGCLAYILLSGKHPFFEPDTKKMFLRVAAGDCEFKPERCWGNTSDHAKVCFLVARVLFFSFRKNRFTPVTAVALGVVRRPSAAP